jgi:hypothetical protein
VDSTQQSTAPSRDRLYNLNHLKPEFIVYLDVLVGNLKATSNGFGRIEIEFENGKPTHVWTTSNAKAGFQF